MVQWLRHCRKGQSLFAIALLLVLSLRILSPAGFMPSVGSNGLVLELCSQAGAQTIIVDLGKSDPGSKQARADSPCAFSLTPALGVLPLSAMAGQALPVPLTALAGWGHAHFTVNRLAAPPPPSQAPPAFY